MTCYLGEGELICESCAVDMTDDDRVIGGESDTPEHCAYCHRPLFEDFDLTEDGVRQVLEKVRKDLKRNAGWRTNPNGPVWLGGYYAGMPWLAVTRDWAEHVLANHRRLRHRLQRRDRRTLELFLYFTREIANGPQPA